MGLLSFFTGFAAEADKPHIALGPEEIGRFGDFIITNSMLYGAILSAVLIAVAYKVGKKANIKPQKGLIAIIEMALEYLIGVLEDVFGSRKKAVKYAPVFSVYFIFIMLSNLTGLLPFVGAGFKFGESYAFRPFTADLNAVIAISLFSILAVQVLSVRENGLKGHVQHYFTDKPQNPINAFVGILEVLGEVTRVISLSLRLFLNTVIGEILVSVFIFLALTQVPAPAFIPEGWAIPFMLIPIVLFEALVAYIQAFIFTVLSATYLAMATEHSDDHGDSGNADHSIAHSEPSSLSVGA